MYENKSVGKLESCKHKYILIQNGWIMVDLMLVNGTKVTFYSIYDQLCADGVEF